MRREEPVEVVMTVPEPYGKRLIYDTGCRTTIGVLVQLLTHSSRRVIISAPYIQNSQILANGVIANALQSALRNNVSVDVLSTGSSLLAINKDYLERENSGLLKFFRPSVNLVNNNVIGSHAKFCVADGKSAYVGSANLTGPGLESQLELGLLVHGKTAPMNKAIEVNGIKPVIGKTFEFQDAASAFEYLKGGLHFGKVVIS